MSDPMADDSRRLNPNSLAAMAQAKNLEMNANTQMRMVYPHVMPLLSKPRFVRRPERVKY
jgi:hypothetical protein